MQEKQNLPYPTVDAACDLQAVRVLSPLCVGRVGELSVIAQCLYQSVRLSACWKEMAADVLERTAQDDVLHFRLLGKAVLALGGNPALNIYPPRKSKRIPQAAAYALQPAAMILETLLLKRQTAAAYEAAAGKLKNAQASHLLLRIALDEKNHAKALSELYRTLCK